MTLEESLCPATKRPNKGFVEARHLWIEGRTTFEKSHFQTAEMPNKALLILLVEELMALGYPSLAYGITKNVFTNSMYLLVSRRAMNTVFRPHVSVYTLIVSQVTLSRRSQEA
jgi:hypothetical protein